MNEIYLKGLEDALLIVLNDMDELSCDCEKCKKLKEKIQQYYAWIIERKIDKIKSMLGGY